MKLLLSWFQKLTLSEDKMLVEHDKDTDGFRIFVVNPKRC